MSSKENKTRLQIEIEKSAKRLEDPAYSFGLFWVNALKQCNKARQESLRNDK